VTSLELKTYPDACLRIKTRPVKQFTSEISETLREMQELMYASGGIGLAATQVGLKFRMLIVEVEDDSMWLINPEILEKSKIKSEMEEGCLSLPGITVNIKRPEKVKIRARNERGDFFVRDLQGLAARAVQHEVDHLNGKLIIDYLGPVRRLVAVKKIAAAKHGQKNKTCEVACYDGKKHNRKPKQSA